MKIIFFKNTWLLVKIDEAEPLFIQIEINME